MISITFQCFLFSVLLIVGGCARLVIPEKLLKPMAPQSSRPESSAQADSYYDYLAAQYYVRTNQIDQATEAYNKALKKDPHSAVLLTELAALYVRQGKIEAALKLTEEAVTYNPDYEQAYMMLGQLYAGSGQNDKAHCLL